MSDRPHLVLLDERGVVVAAGQETARLMSLESVGLVGKDFFSELSFLEGLADAGERYRAGTETSIVTSSPASETAWRVTIEALRLDGRRLGIALVEPMGGASSTTTTAALGSKVKHDVNNLLMGLLGQASLLLARPDVTGEVRRKIEIVADQAEKIRQRVAELGALRNL